MTREHARIRILGKGGTDAGGVGAAGPEAAPRQAAGARLTRHAHARERMLAADCDIVFTQSLYRQIVGHVSSDTSVEQGGLLLGYVEQHPERARPVLVIDRALEAQHTVAALTRLTFTHETWAEFERRTDELRGSGVNRQRVGWYHSHPGHGIFLSEYDLNVCEDFRRPTQVALVVDPVSRDGGFFVRGEAGFRRDTPQGFWEWHDLSEESVVRWQSMSAGRVEWEGAPLAQPPDGAAAADGSSGVRGAGPGAQGAEGEGPNVTALIEAPPTPDAEPGGHASAEPRRAKTVAEAPLWAAALTAAVLLGGVVTLGLFVARIDDDLKSKAERGDLDAVSAQLDGLKRELDRARAQAQPPNPEPAAVGGDEVKEDVTQPEYSSESEPARQRVVDKPAASGNSRDTGAERRGANRNSGSGAAAPNRNGLGSGAADGARTPANVNAQSAPPAAAPTTAPTTAPPPKPSAPAPSPSKTPARTDNGQ